MKKILSPIWLLRIIAAIITISSIVMFTPWIAAYAYLKPLPNTVQEQVANAVNYDLDGIILYVDESSVRNNALVFRTLTGFHKLDQFRTDVERRL